MKFQQLRYLVAVHENGLNITAACAAAAHAWQPGVSRQAEAPGRGTRLSAVRARGPRFLTRTTDAGEEIISRARQHPARNAEHSPHLRQKLRKELDGGTLSDRNHTHPGALCSAGGDLRRHFGTGKYPKVAAALGTKAHQEQIAEMVAPRPASIVRHSHGFGRAIPAFACVCRCTGGTERVVVPRGHPGSGRRKLTLKKLAEYPIASPYVFSISGRSSAAGAVRDGRPVARKRQLTARDLGRNDQDLRAHRFGRGHFGPAGHRPRDRCGSSFVVFRCLPPLCRRPHDVDRLPPQRCCAPVACMSSSMSCWHYSPAAQVGAAKPRNSRPRKR